MRRCWGVLLFVTWAGLLFGTTPARADDASVEVKDNLFSSDPVTVTIGDSVTWTVTGQNAHTVTGAEFDSSPTCVAGIGCMHTGDAFTITFDVAGRYQYHCKIHGDQGMVGTVIVVSATTESSSTTSTSMSTATTSSSLSSSDAASSGAPFQQGTPPTINGTARPTLPQSIVRTPGTKDDDLRPLVLLDVAIAGTTAIVGSVLVRRGRVPFG